MACFSASRMRWSKDGYICELTGLIPCQVQILSRDPSRRLYVDCMLKVLKQFPREVENLPTEVSLGLGSCGEMLHIYAPTCASFDMKTRQPLLKRKLEKTFFILQLNRNVPLMTMAWIQVWCTFCRWTSFFLFQVGISKCWAQVNILILRNRAWRSIKAILSPKSPSHSSYSPSLVLFALSFIRPIHILLVLFAFRAIRLLSRAIRLDVQKSNPYQVGPWSRRVERVTNAPMAMYSVL